MRRKFSAAQERCPPEKPFATCYSPIAIHYPLPSRPADLPTSRFADKFWLGSSIALPDFPVSFQVRANMMSTTKASASSTMRRRTANRDSVGLFRLPNQKS